MVWRYSPITLTVLIIKESLNSAVQQFHEYQQKQSEQPLITSRLRQAQKCGVVKKQWIGSQPSPSC